MEEKLGILLFTKRVERVFIHSSVHAEEVMVSVLLQRFNENEGRLR